jgi:hypothetical protein
MSVANTRKLPRSSDVAPGDATMYLGQWELADGRCRPTVRRPQEVSPISKHPRPGAAWTAGVRSAQVAGSDFPVSQGESEFS